MADGKKYGILRVEKIKLADGGGLRRRATHDFRQNENVSKMFEPKLTRTNEYFVSSSYEQMITKARERWSTLTRQPRSDAVGMLEVMITTTAEALSPMSEKAFFEDCMKEISSWYGAENVVGMAIHRDETTPHCHVFVTPISEKLVKPTRHKAGEIPVETCENRLDCKKVISDRKSLIKLQNDFHKAVFSKYGLSRGDHEPDKKRNMRSDLRKRSERLDKREKALDKYESDLNKYEKNMVNHFAKTVKIINGLDGWKPQVPRKKKFGESQKRYYEQIVIPVVTAINEKNADLTIEALHAEERGYNRAKAEAEGRRLQEKSPYEIQEERQEKIKQTLKRPRAVRRPDIDYER